MSNKKPKGFSGLSQLHSKSEDKADLVESDFQSETPTDTITTPLSKTQSGSQSDNTVDVGSESEVTVGTLQDEQQEGNKSGVSWGYIFGFLLIVGIFIAISQDNDSPSSVPKAATGTSLANPTAKTSTNSQLGSSSAGGKTNKPRNEIPKLQYNKPPLGSNNILSVSQIRWCTREIMRIDAMRNIFDTNGGIDEFNRIVNDYNSRCSNYRYRQGDLSRAEREVEKFRVTIVSEAKQEARSIDTSFKPKANKATKATSNKPASQITRQAQQLLKELGYNPGPIDGDYGRGTANAVKAFQRDIGDEQNGWIDDNLLQKLKSSVEKAKKNTRNRGYSTSPTPSVSAKYFTRGSHQDDVIRIQGTPSSINKYSSYEVWSYGLSSVKISLRDRKVIEWTNSSKNLKVRLTPGSNTTNASYFTRGSHQDDVIRIQGTPSSIDKYSSYEIWSYGLSSVKISLRDRKVIEWANSSKNLKVRLTPGSNTTNASYFTRGSHQDDVIRIQGTPSSIDKYSSYEIWSYGLSSVKISLRDRKVIEWTNSSKNLKVRLTPGSNTTNASYFTRGSHQDDVIRIQGTPSSIDKYSSYEIWSYGLSSVKISSKDKKVIEWTNSSRNLKVR